MPESQPDLTKPFNCRAVLAKRLFSPAECERIIELGEKVSQANATVSSDSGTDYVKNTIRKCNVGWISPAPQSEWIYERIQQEMLRANQEVYGFDLDYLQSFQFTSYGPLHFFKAHVDSGSPEHAVRKISISVQLTPGRQYLGGNLSITSGDGTITASKEQGDATIFPSHLVHQAHTVWWGTRNALVGWYCGKQPLR